MNEGIDDETKEEKVDLYNPIFGQKNSDGGFNSVLALKAYKYRPKKDKVKFESENVINENGINIQIKHDEDDWEIATIKQSKYRHSKVVYKKGSKIIEEKKEELKDDNNIKKQDKNDIEIKINNDK